MQQEQDNLQYLAERTELPLPQGQMLARLQGLIADPVVQWLLKELNDESTARLHAEIQQQCVNVGDVLLRERGFGYADGLLRLQRLLTTLIETLTSQQEHERARDIDEHRAGGSE